MAGVAASKANRFIATPRCCLTPNLYLDHSTQVYGDEPHLTNIDMQDETHVDCYRQDPVGVFRLRKTGPLLDFSDPSHT